MLKWIVKLGLKFVSYQALVDAIASGIAYILEYARKNSSNGGWEKAKESIKEIRHWLDLFDEVYEDDTLTEEEEKKIQDAIANCTVTSTIYNLLQGKEPPKKKGGKKTASTKKTTSKRGKTK